METENKFFEDKPYKNILIDILFAISCIFFGLYNSFSASSTFLSVLYSTIFGMLIFSFWNVIISVAYHILKSTCDELKNIYFSKLLKFILIISNVICFIVAKILILFNLIPIITILITHIIMFSTSALIFLLLIKKHINLSKQFFKIYIAFVIVALAVYCLLWGVL